MVTHSEQQQVPEGYKQSEVGIVPSEWLVCELGNVAPFIGSGKTNTSNKGDYPLFGSTGKIGTCECPEYKGDAILVARVGANAGRLNFVTGEYGVSDNTIIVRIEKSLNIDYFKYQLTKKNLNSLVFGSGQPLITGSQLKALLIPVPDAEEQTAIADALSDVDSLIGSLEKLIAKKRAIKTAAMQQLLTGKKRLPPFDHTHTGYKQTDLGEIPNDWEIRNIESIASKVGSGKTPKGGSTVYINHGRPLVRSQNVGWGKLLLDDVAYISEEVHETFLGSELREGDVLLNITGASIGRCATANNELVGGNVNQHVCIIRVDQKQVDSRIIASLILSTEGQNQIDSFQAGGNREGLNFTQVKALQFALPESKEEQTAITNVLSDMDTELEALEQRLNKTQQLKQGMMQELLTGRTRLG